MYMSAIGTEPARFLAREDCLDCAECGGLCREIQDLFVIPGIVLGDRRAEAAPNR